MGVQTHVHARCLVFQCFVTSCDSRHCMNSSHLPHVPVDFAFYVIIYLRVMTYWVLLAIHMATSRSATSSTGQRATLHLKKPSKARHVRPGLNVSQINNLPVCLGDLKNYGVLLRVEQKAD